MITTCSGLPLGMEIFGANVMEPKMVLPTLKTMPASLLRFTKLAADKLFNKQELVDELDRVGIALWVKPKRNMKPQPQHRYSCRIKHSRWRIERCFAWLKNFRRLATRWETKADHFLAWFKIASACFLARKLHL